MSNTEIATMQSLQEKVKEKISSVFMEMIPDEMMTQLVKTAMENWIKTELPALVKKEMEAKYKEKFNELLSNDSFWQRSEYRGKLPMDALSQIVTQSSSALMESFMEQAVRIGVQKLRNGTY
jgi:hypothetical protein